MIRTALVTWLVSSVPLSLLIGNLIRGLPDASAEESLEPARVLVASSGRR